MKKLEVDTSFNCKKDRVWIAFTPIINLSVEKKLEWGVGYEKNFYVRQFSLTLCWLFFGLYIKYNQQL